MPLSTGVLSTSLRSPLLLHWRARDLSTRAVSGQAGTLTRPNTQSVFDLNGTTISVGREQPCWAAVDTNGDTVRDTIGLALGNSSESYSIQFEAVPQAITLYTRFVPAADGAAGVVLCRLSAASSTNPMLSVHTSAALTLVGYHHNGTSSVQTSGLTWAIGDLLEARLTISAAGAVTLGLTRNNGVETVTAATANLALAAAWSDTKCWLGNVGAAGEFPIYLLSHKVAAGVLTLQQMRDSF